MKQDALQARGDAMKERLMKQVVMVLLFAVAMLLADHSHMDVSARERSDPYADGCGVYLG